jgi:hypothetical protein
VSACDLLTMETPQLRVLDSMSNDVGYSFGRIADDAYLPESEVRRIIRAFRAGGWANYGVLYNEDEPFMCGSGYWLNRDGYKAQQTMRSLMGWRNLWAMREPASVDRSGEAGETHSGSTEGESAVGEAETPVTDDDLWTARNTLSRKMMEGF